MDDRAKLYLLTCGTGDYYVLAKSPNDAKEFLELALEVAEYDFSKNREVTNIKLLAKEIGEFPKDKPRFSEDGDLILITPALRAAK